jgi:hypothetical protein
MNSADNRYLVDVSYSGEQSLYLFTADELTAYLAKGAADAHYSGEYPDSLKLFRYRAGKLTELRTRQVDSDPRPDEDDYIHVRHEILRPGRRREVVELTYTVTIDGRS